MVDKTIRLTDQERQVCVFTRGWGASNNKEIDMWFPLFSFFFIIKLYNI